MIYSYQLHEKKALYICIKDKSTASSFMEFLAENYIDFMSGFAPKRRISKREFKTQLTNTIVIHNHELRNKEVKLSGAEIDAIVEVFFSSSLQQ